MTKKMLPAALVLGILACGNIEEAPRPITDGIDDQLTRFLESYRLAIETRDTTALRAMYVDDGRFQWIEDGSVRYRSPDEVVAALGALSGDLVIHAEYDRTVIAPVGASGASASMGFRTVIGEGPSAYEFGGMISFVLEKGSTGWRIVGGHTSSSRSDSR